MITSTEIKELTQKIGTYRLLENLLGKKKVKSELRVMDYPTAQSAIPDFVAQVYNREMDFPSEIAFLGGLDRFLMEEAQLNGLELISDLDRLDAVSTYAVSDYFTDSESKALFDSFGIQPENRAILIGYLLSDKIKNSSQLGKLGFSSYVNSVIVGHNHRNLRGIGRLLLEKSNEQMERGGSILTTWVDTGVHFLGDVIKPKTNFSHYPGATFWYGQGYRPISVDEAERILPAIQQFQEEHGVKRTYNLSWSTGGDIIKSTGQQILPPEYDERIFSVLNKYYETGWTGIIMVKKR